MLTSCGSNFYLLDHSSVSLKLKLQMPASLLRIFYAGLRLAWPAGRIEYARWACAYFKNSLHIKSAGIALGS